MYFTFKRSMRMDTHVAELGLAFDFGVFRALFLSGVLGVLTLKKPPSNVFSSSRQFSLSETGSDTFN